MKRLRNGVMFPSRKGGIRTSLNTMDLSKERSDPFREEHNREELLTPATMRCRRQPTGYPALAGFSPTTHSTQLHHIGHNCQLRVGTALNPLFMGDFVGFLVGAR